MCDFDSVSKSFRKDLEESEENRSEEYENSGETISQSGLIEILEEHDGTIYENQLSDLGIDSEHAFSVAEESDKIGDTFGTPESSNELQNALTLKEKA